MKNLRAAFSILLLGFASLAYSQEDTMRIRLTVDGKVMDSDMASEMSFWARWGNSSGMAFNAEEFLEEHIQWNYLDGYLKDRPSQPWSLFKAGEE